MFYLIVLVLAIAAGYYFRAPLKAWFAAKRAKFDATVKSDSETKP